MKNLPKISNGVNIKKGLPGVKENILLKNYTTFKVGGPAKYFLVAKNKEDIIKAILVAKKFHPVRDYRDNKKAQRKQISNGVKLPFFVLGGGSNTLVSDRGFKGLVIKVESRMLKVEGSSIYAEAGVSLSESVSTALENNLAGLEWTAGIPGTIGGAIYGNAGAFGKSMGDSVKKVEVLDTKDLRFKICDLRKCKFGYRDSAFKRNKNLIILSVTLQLKKGNKKEIEKKIKEYLKYRKKNQPLNFPSAGSIFKNPPGFFAAKLIEDCGLTGKKIGKAKISEKHANFILNLGGAKAKDVKKLIKLIKQKVKKKFGVKLEEEIQYLF